MKNIDVKTRTPQTTNSLMTSSQRKTHLGSFNPFFRFLGLRRNPHFFGESGSRIKTAWARKLAIIAFVSPRWVPRTGCGKKHQIGERSETAKLVTWNPKSTEKNKKVARPNYKNPFSKLHDTSHNQCIIHKTIKKPCHWNHLEVLQPAITTPFPQKNILNIPYETPPPTNSQTFKQPPLGEWRASAQVCRAETFASCAFCERPAMDGFSPVLVTKVVLFVLIFRFLCGKCCLSCSPCFFPFGFVFKALG